jgi:hypothetical protein
LSTLAAFATFTKPIPDSNAAVISANFINAPLLLQWVIR